MEQHTPHAITEGPQRVRRKRYGSRQLTVRITEDMDDTLRDQARAEGLDVADVARRALARGLAPASPAERVRASAEDAPLPA